MEVLNMKLVKKSLLVASTLALGLTITGCSKKKLNDDKEQYIQIWYKL